MQLVVRSSQCSCLPSLLIQSLTCDIKESCFFFKRPTSPVASAVNEKWKLTLWISPLSLALSISLSLSLSIYIFNTHTHADAHTHTHKHTHTHRINLSLSLSLSVLSISSEYDYDSLSNYLVPFFSLFHFSSFFHFIFFFDLFLSCHPFRWIFLLHYISNQFLQNTPS